MAAPIAQAPATAAAVVAFEACDVEARTLEEPSAEVAKLRSDRVVVAVETLCTDEPSAEQTVRDARGRQASRPPFVIHCVFLL